MSFETRNTIVLGSIWLLLTAGGFFYSKFWQQKELDELEKIGSEIVDLPGLIGEVDLLTSRYQELKREYDSRKKEIPLSDHTSQTYAFISRGLEQAGQIKADMIFSETEDLLEWGYNRYSLLQGEGQFASFYSFIYYLENGRSLYRIHRLNLTHEEDKAIRRPIKFEMEFHAYYSKIAELGISSSARALPMPPLPHNLFYPQPARVVPLTAADVEADVVDVKAVLPGKAFVQYRNALIVLRVGDKVQRGYVSGIDPSQGKVEFTLDEGGVTRKVQKRIQFDKRN